MNQIELRI